MRPAYYGRTVGGMVAAAMMVVVMMMAMMLAIPNRRTFV